VTSYTHSAVDNILRKLKAAGIEPEICARLGNASSVHEDVHEYLMDDGVLTTVKEVAGWVARVRIVCCTVLAAARHPLMPCFRLDCCVMDEAGQISQPASIGALLHTARFVLVGDDYQLPPLVVSTQASAGGMDISLFKRLSSAHPKHVVELVEQYRMNEDIMSVSNKLVYHYKLRCGTDSVAAARLKLPHFPNLRLQGTLREWVADAIDPGRSVVFLDTDPLVVDNKWLETGIKCGGGGAVVNP